MANRSTAQAVGSNIKKQNMLQDVFLNVLWNGNQWYSNVFLFYLFFTQFWCQF